MLFYCLVPIFPEESLCVFVSFDVVVLFISETRLNEFKKVLIEIVSDSTTLYPRMFIGQFNLLFISFHLDI